MFLEEEEKKKEKIASVLLNFNFNLYVCNKLGERGKKKKKEEEVGTTK